MIGRCALLALAACGGSNGKAEWAVADFLLPEGVHLEHTPAGQPELPVTLLEAHGGGWEIRDGDTWEEAVPVDTFSVDLTEGLLLDGELILPPILTVGEDGVTALGEHETWYGTFSRTVTVEVAGGRWAGTQVFAEKLGPVTYTLDGEVRDLVYYERPIDPGDGR